MNAQEETALKNIVRIGEVSSVDVSNRTARVAFADKQDVDGRPLISGPLGIVYMQNEWLPYVGQFVICLFLPNGESDGFVLGGV